MRRYYLIIALFLILVGCSEPAVDTFGNIAGTVTDSNTLSPLAGVTVKLSPIGYSQVTGNDGTFQFDNLDVQEYTISFSRVGYVPHEEKVSVKPGLSSSIQITMKVANVSVPTLFLQNPTNITKTSVKLHAMLSSLGNSNVTQHGFCYSKDHNPTTSDNTIPLGAKTAIGVFSADVTGLEQNKVYYCRAFATNDAGTAYSEEMMFTTLEDNSDVTPALIAVPAGLKAYYTFNNNDCSDATDNELDGVPYNNPIYIEDTPNGFGKAAFINGEKDQCFNINYKLFKGLPNFSISLWLKDFSIGPIISGVSSGRYIDDQWPRLDMRNDGKVLFWVKADGWRSNPAFNSYNYTSLQASDWHHLAVTCTNNGGYSCNLKLYVDGVIVDNVNADWQDPGDYVTKVQIGGNGNGTFSVYSTMKIDNVRIYNRSITNEDIKEIYNAEK